MMSERAGTTHEIAGAVLFVPAGKPSLIDVHGPITCGGYTVA
jgi:hypothetical protein